MLSLIDLVINSKEDALFHRIAYEYSHADWDGLPNHLRDFSNYTYASFRNFILFHFANYWLVLIYGFTVSGLLKIKVIGSVVNSWYFDPSPAV